MLNKYNNIFIRLKLLKQLKLYIEKGGLMDKIELLAPAGSFDALKSAVNAGADAVYIAGKNFGARAYAPNFDDDLLRSALEFCHLRDVKVYAAVNILILNKEFKQLVKYLDFLYKIGIDAVIVQDLGVVKLLQENYPDLKVHASTQMTIHNLDGVYEAEENGISRVVLSRELSLEEIENIAKNSNIEIEVFAHGALCVSYSGQCLMSSLIGGRSGNRGKCAQPCRLRYSLFDKSGRSMEQHLLSMVDLCTIGYIPQLIKAGVRSLKIEGRMKSHQYVASVVSSYRRAIDNFYNGYYFDYDKSVDEMSRIFNRGFSTGYLFNAKPEHMSYKTPKNIGVPLGKVIEKSKNLVKIKLYRDLANGDGVSDATGEHGKKINSIIKNGKSVNAAYEGDIVEINVDFPIKKDDIINKTYDALLNMELENIPEKRSPLEIYARLKKGDPLYIKIKNGIHEVEEKGLINAENSATKDLDEDFIVDKLTQINDTPFYAAKTDVKIEKGLYLPVKEIKRTRRNAIDLLIQSKLNFYRRKDKITDLRLPETMRNHGPVELTFYTDKLNHVKIACDIGIKYIYFNYKLDIDMFKEAFEYAKKTNSNIVPAFPVILRQEIEYAKKQMDVLESLSIDKIMVSNIGLYHISKKYNFKLFIDFPLNVFNSLAAKYFNAFAITLSPELNLNQISDITKRSNVKFEAIVHGRLPLMTTEYCPIKNILECDKGKCKLGYYSIKDRKGNIMPIKNDGFCRIQILNPYILSMVSHINELRASGLSFLRINDTIENDEEIKSILALYVKAISGEDIKMPEGKYTKGHFFRGVL